MAEKEKKRSYGNFSLPDIVAPKPEAKTTELDELLATGFAGPAGPLGAGINPEDDGLTEGERMGGFWGGALDLADDFMPDDLGGILTGKSEQWVPDIPYLTDAYQKSFGWLAEGTLGAGGSVVDAITWFTDNAAAGLAWGVSAMPGGPRTMDLEWEDGGLTNEGDGADISLGQMTITAYGNVFNGLIDFLNNPENQDFTNDYAYFLSDEFDIYNEEDRKKAFEDQNFGKYLSGIQDAAATIALDPFIVFGKPLKVAALGSKSGKFGGIKNAQLVTKLQKSRWREEIDQGLEYHLTSKDPSIATTGRETPAFENVLEFFLTSERDLISGRTNPMLKANNRDGVLAVKSTFAEGDEGLAQAAAFAKVLSGDMTGLVSLKNSGSWNTIDKITEVFNEGVDLFEPLNLGINPRITPLQREIGEGLVEQARIIDELTDLTTPMTSTPVNSSAFLTKKGDLRNLVEMKPVGADDFYIPQQISRSGGRHLGGVKSGIAYRMGKADADNRPNRKQREFDEKRSEPSLGKEEIARKEKTQSMVEDYNTEGWAYRTIRATAGSRPVTIVRWAGKGLPTGIVHLKGGDGATASAEVNNWLRQSYLSPERQAFLLSEFIGAIGVEAKRNTLIKMEMETVSAVAKRLNMKDPKAAEALYKSYNEKRGRKLNEVWSSSDEVIDNGKPAFTTTEDGGVLTIPGLYSELDEAFPLLDIREFRSVVNSNSKALQNWAQLKDAGFDVFDILNNGWKISVLLRVGYSSRNLVEGGLRSLAAIGFLATNPQVLARVPAAMKYQMIKYSGKKKFQAMGEALVYARGNLEETTGILKRLDLENNQDQIARAGKELREQQNLLSVLLDVSAQKRAGTLTTAEEGLALPILKEYDSVKNTSSYSSRNIPDTAEVGLTKSEKAIAKSQESIDRKTIEIQKLEKERSNFPKDSVQYKNRTTKINNKNGEIKRSKSYQEKNKTNIPKERLALRAQKIQKDKNNKAIADSNVDKANAKSLDNYSDAARADQIKRNIKDLEDYLDLLFKNEGQLIDTSALPSKGSSFDAKTGTLNIEAPPSVALLEKKLNDLQETFNANIASKLDLDRQVNYLATNVEKQIKQINEALARLEDSKSIKWVDKVAGREVQSTRISKIGEGGNVVGRREDGTDIVFDAAFDGTEGSLARLLSAADKTYQQIFKTGFESQVKGLKAKGEYVIVNPAHIPKNDFEAWAHYWNNLTDRLNKRYRQDEVIGKRWLKYGDDEAGMLDDTQRWLMSDGQQGFRSNFETRTGRPLNKENGKPDPDAVEEFLNEMYRRYTNELPKGTGVRETLLNREMTSLEVQVAISKADELPVITALPRVKERKGIFKNAVYSSSDGDSILFKKTATKAVSSAAGSAMKLLGSLPETKLLRHPFYAASYKQQQMKLVRMAIEDGKNLDNLSIQNKINKASHQEALKSTRETMYTIERQTNASNLLRFIMPFFPAWENTLKTWTRLVYQNPAIIAYGNALWNIPNSLGMVVDEDGNRVDSSNMFSSTENHFVALPAGAQKVLDKIQNIPVVGSVGRQIPMLNTFMTPLDEDGNSIPVKVRQSGANVILQGGLFDPGVGPLSLIPAKLLLAGKPELTEVLRKYAGDEGFRKIVPTGDPNVSISNAVFPTIIKRIQVRLFGEETENTAYTRLKIAMIQDEVIKFALRDEIVSEKDMERVIKNANRFWTWSIGQAGTGFTAASSYNSPYAIERKIWRDLLDDTSLNYTQKRELFVKKIEIARPGVDGNAFSELTKSTTDSDYKINPNLQSYKRLKKDPELVEMIAKEYGEKYVGMYTNVGDWDQVYSKSVYSELGKESIDGDKLKEKKSPEEIIKDGQISEGWRNYFLQVEKIDELAIELGFNSYKDLDGYGEYLDQVQNQLSRKYPAFAAELAKGYNTNGINLSVLTARLIVSEATDGDLKVNPTINKIAEFLEWREFISKKLEATTDRKERKEIVRVGNERIGSLRAGADPGFVDFYDKYFSTDDFRYVRS